MKLNQLKKNHMYTEINLWSVNKISLINWELTQFDIVQKITTLSLKKKH
jgi:hypothetical protein